MARRSDHTREELKQLILDRALEHLQTEPIQGLSLRQLAKKVGYVPSSLLNVFGSYNYCLLAVSGIGLDRLTNYCQRAIESSTQAETKIAAMALAYYQFATEQTNLWRLMLELKLAEDEEIPANHLNKITHLFGLLEVSLKQLKPGLDETEYTDASRTLWASVQGITQMSLDDKLFSQPLLGEKLITDLVRHYLTSWQK
ncbi:TetR/AcrR family transcriptional regulator [Catenovulum maritimum]|uniref:HTH-type transcriptional regulator MT1864/Rv1816-like C-terminal domain-containing protein n=1 Tax=Catenovulum maritimum TaxID=1513271 RepID=A0A0J8GXU0_9ALTE|nr:TetR/AcrR family transcriptional regulator [Catenovulum maritimum]KMT66044.1 hypothetical protein XM47_06245 [Catenovulum maritimum]